MATPSSSGNELGSRWLALLFGLFGCQPSAQAITWQDTRPAEAVLDADGVPDFVGICDDPTPPHRHRVCAVDGATLKLAWRSEPVAGQPRSITIGAAGGKAALVDELANLHVYDLATGKELPPFHRFGDRAVQICAPPEEPGKLWIQLANKTGIFFDPAGMKLVPGAWPRSCIEARCMGDLVSSREPECEVKRPLLPGYPTHWAFADARDGVALAYRHPGSHAPMILGFAPGPAPTVRWLRGLAGDDPLTARDDSRLNAVHVVAGRAVYAYEDLSRRYHIIAVEPATGRTLWDVPSSESGRLTVTASRVYVHYASLLEVRDAATGKLLGSVGKSR